jgi:hypothetical protein
LPSSQFTAEPWQAPAAHTSLAVHAEPSLQLAVLFACWQPLAGLQLSSVQTLLSSQLMLAPLQTPEPHTSFAVQAEPSSHLSELFECRQPVAA